MMATEITRAMIRGNSDNRVKENNNIRKKQKKVEDEGEGRVLLKRRINNDFDNYRNKINCNNTHGRNTRKPHESSMLSYQNLLTILFLILNGITVVQAQQQGNDPMSMNGGSVLAMAGDECIALAVDKRFGSGMQMVNIVPRHVLSVNPSLLIAFTGLEGDIQSLSQEISKQISFKHSRALGFSTSATTTIPRKHSVLSPSSMTMLTSHIMYNRRRAPYYVEPLIVGLHRQPKPPKSKEEKKKNGDNDNDNDNRKDNDNFYYRPILSSLDVIGAISKSDAFVCGGVASTSLFGTAEAYWKPNLKKEELLQVCSKAFLSALERDCLSGYGAVIYLITPDGIMQYDYMTRND